MKLAVTFAVTTGNDIMFAYASLRPRPGLGKRLRTKTSPDAPVVAVAPHIKPYLDKLYEQIAENPSITVQGLSDLFVSKYGNLFDVVQLRAATARLKRRHAIFKAWQSELDVDCGVRREEGLIDPPSNIGSMSEHDFFLFLIVVSRAIVADCGHSRLLVVRLYLVTPIHLIRIRRQIHFRMFVGPVVALLLMFCNRRDRNWTPTNFTIRRSFPIGLFMIQSIVFLRCSVMLLWSPC